MSHAPTAALDRRHQAVRADLAARGLDALIVTALPNILYLTNFVGSSAIVVVTSEGIFFVTDFRYLTTVGETRGTAHACPGLELVRADGSYDATLVELIGSHGWARVGFEAAHVTVARHQWLTAALRADAPRERELAPTEGVVERSRVRKDAYEIATLREAARRLSVVAEQAVVDVRPARTERDVAAAIDARIRQAGFARTAFDTIVAAGANAALPHHAPGGRKLTEGDLVVLDFGGV
jgi:Xaa-Pro aminopeptidase